MQNFYAYVSQVAAAQATSAAASAAASTSSLHAIGEIQMLLSAIFIFIGATVFFISSLISGRSIFRDLSYQIGLLVSTIVGFLLFAFSPISFLVVDPSLFKITEGGGAMYVEIHKKIVDCFFVPFLFSALGLGATFGALEAINGRTLFLRWLRTSIRVKYPILSYGYSWDGFLLSLKKGARIRIVLKNQTVYKGRLEYASIREEQKQIALDCEGAHRLIDGADIAYLEAEDNAFNRNLDEISHHAEAFYLAIAVFGLLLLATSAGLIECYFASKSNFHGLAKLYCWLFWFLLILAIVFGWISYRASRQDFRNWRSYFVLCTAVPPFLLIEAVVFLCLTLWEIMARCADLNHWTRALAAFLAIAVLLLIWYRHRKGIKVDDLITRIILSNGDRHLSAEETLEYLKEVCQFIYLKMDMNRSAPVRWDELCPDFPSHWEAGGIQHDLLNCLRRKLTHLVARDTFLDGKQYLEGEDFNIVLRLLGKLEKEISKTRPELTD